MKLFKKVIILLEFACWMSSSCAQPSATLHPQEPQNVCPGQTIAYNCVANGSKIELFSPPFVDESRSLTLYRNGSGQTCNVRTGSAAALVLVDTPDELPFVGTLVIYISTDQTQSSYDVYCRVSTAEGTATLSSAYFTVINKLNTSELNETSLDVSDSVVSYNDATAQVNVTWNMLEGAEEFIIELEEINQTIHAVENYFILTLPYGTYSASIIAKNQCGTYLESFMIMVEATAAPRTVDVASIVLGVLSGVISIICCCLTLCCLIFYLRQRKKLFEVRYHALDEDMDSTHHNYLDFEPDSLPLSRGYTLGSPGSTLSPQYLGPVGTLSIPRKLCVYTANCRTGPDINSGDKIILSRHVLMSCLQQEYSLPISFKLEHPETGKVIHAGVFDYTSPSPEMASLPRWMMEHLGAREGEEMMFDHADLPPGTFVKLQPLSSSWLGIPYETRTEIMESQLRKFQTLTEGTVITLTYELNRYSLKVLECKPSKGILIQDVDIATDVVEPADVTNGNYSIVEGQVINIGLDEPITCQAEAKNYKYFMLLPGQALPPRVRVEVKCIRGDPDVFLSQTCSTPSQSRYTWCNQDVGYSEIQLSTDDKNYNVEKPLFAGVVSLCEDAEFMITFHRNDTLAASRARHPSASGKTLRDINHQHSSTSSTATPVLLTSSPSSLSENERCYSCHRVMPIHLLAMHERHCAQQTYKCPTCDKCVPKMAEKKHHLIAHELLTCECGEKFSQLDLHRHQETECTKRFVKCRFKLCNLSFPIDELMNHEELCQTKIVSCPVCNEEVMQREVEGHLEAFHGTPDNLTSV